MGGHSVSTVRELSNWTQTSATSQLTLTNNSTILNTMTHVRQNYHQDSEALINMELYASYVCLSMSAYFARDDLALHGFAKRFRAASAKEKEHAEKLIDYQNMRGGRVIFRESAKPSTDDWGTALEAVLPSLELEKTVNESLLAMHKVADDHNGAQMTDFLEGNYLEEQVEAIKEISDLVTKMKRAGDGLGLHTIDQELLS